ncbi:MAG: dethiobiotin synthase [bacterium]|nr:dethiobiotin synthase [bacterium]
MRGIFITGTDTGVGKTIISAAIACGLKEKGINVGIMKPVGSGGKKRGNHFVSNDALILKKAAGVSDPLELINPICFKTQIAPYPASLIEKREINLNKIYSSYEKLCKKHEFMVVEGIGGVLVPIKKNYFVIDLIKKLGLSVIVVCRPGLGTINHTLLTINALLSNKIKIICLVFNKTSPDMEDLSEKSNLEIIKKLSGIRVIKNPFINLDKTCK